MTKKKCKKLGNGATKRDIKEAHRAKMEIKRVMQLMREPDNKEWIFANISKRHKFYGDTPREHEERKRNAA